MILLLLVAFAVVFISWGFAKTRIKQTNSKNKNKLQSTSSTLKVKLTQQPQLLQADQKVDT